MAEVRKIAVKASDFATALEFLEGTLGLTQKFSDGVDYAELNGSLGVAVLSDEHYPADAVGGVSLMVKVDAIAASVAQLTAAGATQLGGLIEGGHEFRTVITIPGTSVTAILYGPER